jgi:hypothetical protein
LLIAWCDLDRLGCSLGKGNDIAALPAGGQQLTQIQHRRRIRQLQSATGDSQGWVKSQGKSGR